MAASWSVSTTHVPASVRCAMELLAGATFLAVVA